MVEQKERELYNDCMKTRQKLMGIGMRNLAAVKTNLFLSDRKMDNNAKKAPEKCLLIYRNN